MEIKSVSTPNAPAPGGHLNEVCARVMGEHRPARAVIPTRDLHYGFLIEIDAMAATYA